jgi:hypothetical protein
MNTNDINKASFTAGYLFGKTHGVEHQFEYGSYHLGVLSRHYKAPDEWLKGYSKAEQEWLNSLTDTGA